MDTERRSASILPSEWLGDRGMRSPADASPCYGALGEAVAAPSASEAVLSEAVRRVLFSRARGETRARACVFISDEIHQRSFAVEH